MVCGFVAGAGHTLAARAALNYFRGHMVIGRSRMTGDRVVVVLVAVAITLLVAAVAVGAGVF
jgi:hypothetical protein